MLFLSGSGLQSVPRVGEGARRELLYLVQELLRLHVSVQPRLVLVAAAEAERGGAEVPLEAVWRRARGPGHPRSRLRRVRGLLLAVVAQGLAAPDAETCGTSELAISVFMPALACRICSCNI